jgi:nucleosome binding factor SPN SPT16 subunit
MSASLKFVQTGVEFRDSAYLLSSKNSKHLKTDMVLNLSLGFSDLLDDNGKKYVSLLWSTAVPFMLAFQIRPPHSRHYSRWR